MPPASPTSRFRHEEDPAQPGWLTWDLSDPTRFNATLGPMRVRAEPNGTTRVRIVPVRAHTNYSDNVHGGVILALIDIAMFAGARMAGLADAGSAVTLDCNAQFLSSGRPDRPLDALVEMLRETRRLVFLRGLVVQDDGAGGEAKVAAFSGTLRKGSTAPVRADPAGA